MSQMLTEAIARSMGASVAEEIIQEVCHGCAKGNLDFSEPEFCPIQANYGFEGEDEHIVCETGTRVWCTEYVESAPAADDGVPISDEDKAMAVMMRMLIKAMVRDMREIADNPLIDDNVVIRRLTSERMEPEDMTLRQMVDRYEFLLMAIGIEAGT